MWVLVLNLKHFQTAISDDPCIVVQISTQVTSFVILLATMLSFKCYCTCILYVRILPQGLLRKKPITNIIIIITMYHLFLTALFSQRRYRKQVITCFLDSSHMYWVSDLLWFLWQGLLSSSHFPVCTKIIRYFLLAGNNINVDPLMFDLSGIWTFSEINTEETLRVCLFLFLFTG